MSVYEEIPSYEESRFTWENENALQDQATDCLNYFTAIVAKEQGTKQWPLKKLQQIKAWWIILGLLVVLWIAGLYSEKRILIQNHQKRIQSLEDTVLETQLKYQATLQENRALQNQEKVRIDGEIGSDVAFTEPIREVFTESVTAYRAKQ